jgi:oxalate decarboxylase/phosphoglucose isomerase-like protein (cupin superfamily)
MNFDSNSSQVPNPLWQSQVAIRLGNDMKPVLMSPESAGVENQYYMIRGGSERGNITIWSAGANGTEYIKAYGHVHTSDFIETYTVLQGEGYMILQSPSPSFENPDAILAVQLQKGDSITIPPFWGHAAINTSNSWLVTIDNSPVAGFEGSEASMPSHANYEIVTKNKGMAYYLINSSSIFATSKQISENVFAQANPHYAHLPELTVFDTVKSYTQYARKSGLLT